MSRCDDEPIMSQLADVMVNIKLISPAPSVHLLCVPLWLIAARKTFLTTERPQVWHGGHKEV